MLNAISEKRHEILSLICEVTRAVKCCQQEEAFCEDVTFSQFLILDAVGKAGKLRLSTLHGILAVEKSTTTRMVDPLVKKGLVVREKAKSDSRAVNLRLTAEGNDVWETVWMCLATCLDAIENQIPEDKRKDVYHDVRLFSRAVQNICSNGRCQRDLCEGTKP